MSGGADFFDEMTRDDVEHELYEEEEEEEYTVETMEENRREVCLLYD